MLSESELAKRVLKASRGSEAGLKGRLPCQRRGCKGFSLEVGGQVSGGAGATGMAIKSGGDMVQHRAPSCERCKGLFCSR